MTSWRASTCFAAAYGRSACILAFFLARVVFGMCPSVLVHIFHSCMDEMRVQVYVSQHVRSAGVRCISVLACMHSARG
jgi:hypothetical protein